MSGKTFQNFDKRVRERKNSVADKQFARKYDKNIFPLSQLAFM
jgi:hypothetical protein